MNKKQRTRRAARQKRAARNQIAREQEEREREFRIRDCPRVIQKDTKKVPLRATFYIKTHGGGYRRGWEGAPRPE